MHRLWQFVTCGKVPKLKDSRREDPFVSMPAPLVDEDHQDGTPLPAFSKVEMYGYSKMGSGPGKSECQDSYAMLPNLTPNLHSFGVYDGHGLKGKDVSLFVNQQLTNCIRKNAPNIEKLVGKDYMDSFFKTTFKIVENKLSHSPINTSISGTCCLTVVLSHGRCFIANLGDSRAVLCRQSLDRQPFAVDLSYDHKPSREDEKKRILALGGRVEPVYYEGTAVGPLRVWTKNKQGGIAVTRAMGDTRGRKAGLIAEPEVTRFDLEPTDKFIVAASDGLWDVFSSQEAVAFVLDYLASGRAKSQVAKVMIREASRRWENMEPNSDDPYRDDITVIVVFLNSGSSSTTMETPIKSPVS